MSYNVTTGAVLREEFALAVDELTIPLEAANQQAHFEAAKSALVTLGKSVRTETGYLSGSASGHVCPRDAEGNPVGSWSTSDSSSVSVAQALSPQALPPQTGTP